MNEQDLELLSAYLDNALSQSDRVGVEQRLAADPEFRGELESLQVTVKLIQLLPELTAPRSFALTKEQARRPARILNFPTLISAASAVAAIALLLLGLSLLSRQQFTAENQVAALATSTSSEVTTTSDGYSAVSPLPAATVQIASPTVAVEVPLMLVAPTETAVQQSMADMAFAATMIGTLDEAAPPSVQTGNAAQELTPAPDTASSESAGAGLAAQPEGQSVGDANGAVAGYTNTTIAATPLPFPTAAPTQLAESTHTTSEIAAQATHATESRTTETDEAEAVNDSDITVAGENAQSITTDAIMPTESPAPADLARAAQTDQSWLGATLITIGGVLLIITVLIWLSGRQR